MYRTCLYVHPVGYVCLKSFFICCRLCIILFLQVQCAEALLETVEEELTCDRLITSARRRDSSIASKIIDKVLNIVNSKHGPWADKSTLERYVLVVMQWLEMIRFCLSYFHFDDKNSHTHYQRVKRKVTHFMVSKMVTDFLVVKK